MRPQPHHLLQQLGPGQGGEGGGGAGPDAGRVVRRHLGHPVPVLPRAAHRHPALPGDRVHVVSVERGLHPGRGHPQHLAAQGQRGGVIGKPSS